MRFLLLAATLAACASAAPSTQEFAAKLRSLGYRASEISDIRPAVARVVAQRGLPRPRAGMPDSWREADAGRASGVRGVASLRRVARFEPGPRVSNNPSPPRRPAKPHPLVAFIRGTARSVKAICGRCVDLAKLTAPPIAAAISASVVARLRKRRPPIARFGSSGRERVDPPGSPNEPAPGASLIAVDVAMLRRYAAPTDHRGWVSRPSDASMPCAPGLPR